ncbi:hypothetical protein SAY86_015255 [Trapa natans]|uniref:Uncharacterized protein n=1 Tax=Trapa natans TaxID=22666 RepID=A0AAN7KJ07_TRANT|nr:hypothetical protein SAY86_015255 [Trapa natans]
MDTSGRISKYRDRLDKTLALSGLTNPESLESLIRSHLLSTSLDGVDGYSEGLLKRRTSEVSNFLDMLRSASIKSDGPEAVEKLHPQWKLKQDNEEFRVMYREGPPGSPFHTLLVEGYVDGPIDVCLCVSWEPSLYKKWWPQYNVPAFKVVSSKRLQRIHIGEQICSVRMKVPWPLSVREALVQFFEFDYFQDDLIIVLMNTINEAESIDRSTHDYTNDMIPEANDVVRIDIVGGFALQKVTASRSYFRTIANMDLKLDFVPPSLINFISRQLIGSGFRLYQKAVASVYISDEEYKNALGDRLYGRIRDALSHTEEQNVKLEDKGPKNDTTDNLQKIHLVEVIQENPKKISCEDTNTVEVVQEGIEETKEEIHVVQNEVEISSHSMIAHNATSTCEIEDVGNEESRKIERSSHGMNKRNDHISPKVEEALGILEKVIAMSREHGWNAHNRLSSSDPETKYHDKEKSTPTCERTALGDQAVTEISNQEAIERCLEELWDSSSGHSLRSKKSSNSLKEVNHNRVAPASPVENLIVPSQTDGVSPYSMEKGKVEEPHHDSNNTVPMTDEIKEDSMEEVKASRNPWMKYRLWCFHPSSR